MKEEKVDENVGKEDVDVDEEMLDKPDPQEKRKRRVSEDPSSSSANPSSDCPTSGDVTTTTTSLPTLSVTPTATIVKRDRVQDDRAKIAELYSTIKRTINLLIQMCENHFREKSKSGGVAESSPSESLSKSKLVILEVSTAASSSSSTLGENRPEPMDEDELKKSGENQKE